MIPVDMSPNSYETADDTWQEKVRTAQRIRATGDAVTLQGGRLRDEARRLVARSRSARSEFTSASRIAMLRRTIASRREERTMTRDAAAAIAAARAERDAAMAALVRARMAMESITDSIAGTSRSARSVYADAD